MNNPVFTHTTPSSLCSTTLLLPTIVSRLSVLFQIIAFKLYVVPEDWLVHVTPLSDDVNIVPNSPIATNNPKSSAYIILVRLSLPVLTFTQLAPLIDV